MEIFFPLEIFRHHVIIIYPFKKNKKQKTHTPSGRYKQSIRH